MKVLVCGGRDYIDAEYLDQTLDNFHRLFNFTQVIHGAARGADSLAGIWARARGIDEKPYPVLKGDWDKHGKRAGSLRNREMLVDGKPDIVVAFPGHNGTWDMIQQARYAGVHVLWVGILA